jgi:hypothetical protein
MAEMASSMFCSVAVEPIAAAVGQASCALGVPVCPLSELCALPFSDSRIVVSPLAPPLPPSPPGSEAESRKGTSASTRAHASRPSGDVAKSSTSASTLAASRDQRFVRRHTPGYGT